MHSITRMTVVFVGNQAVEVQVEGLKPYYEEDGTPSGDYKSIGANASTADFAAAYETANGDAPDVELWNKLGAAGLEMLVPGEE